MKTGKQTRYVVK